MKRILMIAVLTSVLLSCNDGAGRVTSSPESITKHSKCDSLSAESYLKMLAKFMEDDSFTSESHSKGDLKKVVRLYNTSFLIQDNDLINNASKGFRDYFDRYLRGSVIEQGGFNSVGKGMTLFSPRLQLHLGPSNGLDCSERFVIIE
jgi:hypothetical protein